MSLSRITSPVVGKEVFGREARDWVRRALRWRRS